jgi:hypothetical protein
MKWVYTGAEADVAMIGVAGMRQNIISIARRERYIKN